MGGNSTKVVLNGLVGELTEQHLEYIDGHFSRGRENIILDLTNSLTKIENQPNGWLEDHENHEILYPNTS